MESYLVYLVVKWVLTVFRFFPRVLGRWILNSLGSLTYWLDIKHRRIAKVNLRIAFPRLSSQERARIAKRSFQITAQNLLEISRLGSLTRENIGSLVDYDPENGLNNFESARMRGRPILYLTGHFSSWELLPAAHALYGHPLSFVTRPLDNPRIERLLCTIRESSGNRVISKRNAVRQILKTLHASGSVGILMDQNTDPQEGVFVDFFGLPAYTASGTALIALRTNATVLPGYLTVPKKGRYRIKFLPPLDLIRTGDMSRDIVENTRLFNRVLESIVREQPESWLWGHKRWSYQESKLPGNVYRMTEQGLNSYLREIAGRGP